MRDMLEREFNDDEVERALKQMSALKSSGSDRFGDGFYKTTRGW